jgi:replication fork protection complex subunit Tof1/Swi1
MASNSRDDLTKLLDIENQRKRNVQRNAASRHSRFGTTISVKAGQEVMVLHSHEAITKEARDIVDGKKKSKHRKAKTLVVTRVIICSSAILTHPITG